MENNFFIALCEWQRQKGFRENFCNLLQLHCCSHEGDKTEIICGFCCWKKGIKTNKLNNEIAIIFRFDEFSILLLFHEWYCMMSNYYELASIICFIIPIPNSVSQKNKISTQKLQAKNYHNKLHTWQHTISICVYTPSYSPYNPMLPLFHTAVRVDFYYLTIELIWMWQRQKEKKFIHAANRMLKRLSEEADTPLTNSKMALLGAIKNLEIVSLFFADIFICLNDEKYYDKHCSVMFFIRVHGGQ